MIYLYQLKRVFEDLKAVILPSHDMKLHCLSCLRISIEDLFRLLINPYALMEDEKWNSIELRAEETGYNHKLIIFNGTFRRHPMILITDKSSIIYQYDIFNKFTVVPLEKDYEIKYRYLIYKISDEDYDHYKKFVDYNRKTLEDIYYDIHSYDDESAFNALIYI